LDRREAVLLLQEISSCPEALLINLVLLKPSENPADPTSVDYELHLKTEYGKSIPKCMSGIVRNHGLRIELDPYGCFVICGHEKRLVEITA
jgi:hypothetical protein